MVKEREKKDHVIHERKLRYYKKTVQLLTIGLEIFFLFLIATFVFLYINGEENIKLQAKNTQLELEQQTMHAQIETLRDQIVTTQLSLPRTQIKDEKFIAEFLSLKGEPTNITINTSEVFQQIQDGYQRRELIEEINIPMHNKYAQTCYDFTSYFSTPKTAEELKKNFAKELDVLKEKGPQYINLPIGNTNQYVIDFRDFVSPKGFENEMKTMYEQRRSNEEFIRTLWYIVSQVTTFTPEIQETPRYPLETLFLGEGDCEDSAILLASMIKAAPTNWKVSFVYIDLANPQAPTTYNHVLVHIDTGSKEYFIETTNKDVMSPYSNVEGASILLS